MHKIATRIFIWASVAFGIIGILMVLTTPASGIDAMASDFNMLLRRLLFVTVFIILPSFALSVASTYLSRKS